MPSALPDGGNMGTNWRHTFANVKIKFETEMIRDINVTRTH
jgi:hypothetical protein